MASLNLSQDELKAVEQTRQRLSQLSNSIGSLKNDVMHQYPLPPLESLQASADILQHNLRTLLDIVTQHNDLFTRVAVHPSTNYPGRTQEGILFQLLRKKADPDVANSMDEGRKTLANLAQVGTSTSTTAAPARNGNPGNDAGNNATKHAMLLSIDPNAEQDGAVMARIEAQESELEGIWSRAQQACHERVMRYAQFEDNDPYTAEEREMGVENVRTGLRKPLESDDEDEDDEDEDEDGDGNQAGGMRRASGDVDDDDVMIIDRPPPPPAPAVKAHDVDGAALESILRFGARGEFFAA
ncbi:mediator of RNA polymerase II transcription complex subunit 8-domain-containing protein [Microdochium trichocladiopsis]|uniref:Mediator of RNA polymerase II transcription subunit 8 n=1 Tax=Microdochium trichocladiopsis TaxID=1682393 RepID=A0A9P8Y248_9PEZI|nr:mediator of RNA polymerase II transcription complex subunit 8-domain-containing protein [Microdochium trichocladiopsis]KAH7027812.1 mediator of RNA polymerase II transcription complex subunit 8-domain-containing protein [Microdochium trichocladiopsis]